MGRRVQPVSFHDDDGILGVRFCRGRFRNLFLDELQTRYAEILAALARLRRKVRMILVRIPRVANAPAFLPGAILRRPFRTLSLSLRESIQTQVEVMGGPRSAE